MQNFIRDYDCIFWANQNTWTDTQSFNGNKNNQSERFNLNWVSSWCPKKTSPRPYASVTPLQIERGSLPACRQGVRFILHGDFWFKTWCGYSDILKWLTVDWIKTVITFRVRSDCFTLSIELLFSEYKIFNAKMMQSIQKCFWLTNIFLKTKMNCWCNTIVSSLRFLPEEFVDWYFNLKMRQSI